MSSLYEKYFIEDISINMRTQVTKHIYSHTHTHNIVTKCHFHHQIGKIIKNNNLHSQQKYREKQGLLYNIRGIVNPYILGRGVKVDNFHQTLKYIRFIILGWPHASQ